ncbi:MAG TPA: lysylphosphatidylglycerol synthase transmembrane domain-containing protein [Gaiellaceae bacterium]|nr:lysylphosphatidylglycerol synthase transmembrane domain-containing protein [Gaiellaceae bacterium]
MALAAAAGVLGLSAVIASQAPKHDKAVADALATVLGWAGGLWRTLFVCLLALAFAIIVDVLVSRRWDLARDVVVAALVLAGASMVLGGIVDSDWIPLRAHPLSQWGYPDVRLAAATAVVVVVGPELVRPVRLVAACLVPLAALGAVVFAAALPAAMLGALALGLASGSLVRLVFGTAAGVPPTGQIMAALLTLGVDAAELEPAAQQRIGSAEYVGQDREGRPLRVRVLGRDAQDTQWLARRWQSLAYRDPPRSIAVGRLEQVEHEALVTVLAGQSGVRVPEVVTAAIGPTGDALVVTHQPAVEPLETAPAEQVTDELLEKVWEQAARLQSAGISHGRLNASNVLVVDGRPMIVDFSAATLGAPQSALDMDAAEIIVASTILVGTDRAWRTARQAGWTGTVGRVLPYLQRAALTPHLRDLARQHELDLKDLRAKAAAATGQEAPDVAPLRRIRPKDLLLTVALIFGAYLLISKLAAIGFGTIAHELGKADVAWVIVGLILAQTTFVASGVSVRGAVMTPLPLLPCVVLQSAIKFINLTVPSSAGRIGMNLRFLQRMGTSLPEAVAAGAVDDASETIVQVALFLLVLPFVHSTLQASKFHASAPNGRLVAALAGALVISIALILAVPKLRAKVVPPARQALAGLWNVARDRHKRIELFGGNLGSELLYAISLGATCLAYGVHLNLAELVFVNTAASVLSSLIPVPGGIGAAEASLSAGLIAVGVDESTAFAIAITQRLCTFYLPPIWGYFSLRWLTHKGYV